MCVHRCSADGRGGGVCALTLFGIVCTAGESGVEMTQGGFAFGALCTVASCRWKLAYGQPPSLGECK